MSMTLTQFQAMQALALALTPQTAVATADILSDRQALAVAEALEAFGHDAAAQPWRLTRSRAIPTPASTFTNALRRGLEAPVGATPLAELDALLPGMVQAETCGDIEVGQLAGILAACPDLTEVMACLFPADTGAEQDSVDRTGLYRTEVLLREMVRRCPARFALTPLLGLAYAAALRGDHAHARELCQAAIDCAFNGAALVRLTQLREMLLGEVPRLV